MSQTLENTPQKSKYIYFLKKNYFSLANPTEWVKNSLHAENKILRTEIRICQLFDMRCQREALQILEF